MSIPAGQTSYDGGTCMDARDTIWRQVARDKAIPRSRIWRSGSTGDLTDMEVSAMANLTPTMPLTTTTAGGVR